MAVPLPVRAYITSVSLAGALALVWVFLVPDAPLDLLGLSLAVLALFTSNSTVPVPGTGARLSADTPFLLALVLLGNTRAAVVLAGVDMTISTLASGLGRKRPHIVPFNAAAGMLGTGAAALLYGVSAGLVSPLPALAAGGAMFLVNAAVVGGAIRVSTGVTPPREWRDGLLVTGIGYLASASLAWLMSRVPGALSWGLLATPLVGLVWLMYRSHRAEATEKLERHREREEVFLPGLQALVTAIEARDQTTCGHNERARAYAVGLARAMDIDDESILQSLRYGALLHDLGKVAIPDSLLHAQRKLTEEEMVRVRKHVTIGADLIRQVPFPPGVVDIVLHHHERWDGKGYPHKLAGEAIPFGARIVAVAETFDDLRTGGGWRAPVSAAEALAVIEAERGHAFDPEIAETFVRWQRAVPASPEEARRWSEAQQAILQSSMEQARLFDLAFLDELTGLANRRALDRDIARYGAAGPIGVLMMDLDGFKGINDHFGHDIGDVALRIVGRSMRDLQTDARRCYRNGGDEFVVLLIGCDDLEHEITTVRSAVEREPIPLNAQEYLPIRTSIGAIIGEGTPDDLLHAADGAMYDDKQRRRAGRVRGAKPEVLRIA